MGWFSKKPDAPAAEVRTYRDEYENIYLAGGHLAGRQRILATLAQTPMPLELELVREPENKHDRHALAVYGLGHQIGYIPRDRARMFCEFMDGRRQPEAFLTALELYENEDGDELIGGRIFVGFDRVT